MHISRGLLVAVATCTPGAVAVLQGPIRVQGVGDPRSAVNEVLSVAEERTSISLFPSASSGLQEYASRSNLPQSQATKDIADIISSDQGDDSDHSVPQWLRKIFNRLSRKPSNSKAQATISSSTQSIRASANSSAKKPDSSSSSSRGSRSGSDNDDDDYDDDEEDSRSSRSCGSNSRNGNSRSGSSKQGISRDDGGDEDDQSGDSRSNSWFKWGNIGLKNKASNFGQSNSIGWKADDLDAFDDAPLADPLEDVPDHVNNWINNLPSGADLIPIKDIVDGYPGIQCPKKVANWLKRLPKAYWKISIGWISSIAKNDGDEDVNDLTNQWIPPAVKSYFDSLSPESKLLLFKSLVRVSGVPTRIQSYLSGIPYNTATMPIASLLTHTAKREVAMTTIDVSPTSAPIVAPGLKSAEKRTDGMKTEKKKQLVQSAASIAKQVYSSAKPLQSATAKVSRAVDVEARDVAYAVPDPKDPSKAWKVHDSETERKKEEKKQNHEHKKHPVKSAVSAINSAVNSASAKVSKAIEHRKAVIASIPFSTGLKTSSKPAITAPSSSLLKQVEGKKSAAQKEDEKKQKKQPIQRALHSNHTAKISAAAKVSRAVGVEMEKRTPHKAKMTMATKTRSISPAYSSALAKVKNRPLEEKIKDQLKHEDTLKTKLAPEPKKLSKEDEEIKMAENKHQPANGYAKWRFMW